MAKPEGGRFDEDTYERARKWRESQEAKADAPAPKPVAKAKPAAKPAAEMPKAGTGSGRGGVGGPTADELESYAKKRADDKFEQSIKDNLVTSERDEMNKYRDRAVGAGTAAVALAAPMLGGAMRAKKATEPLATMREMTKGGPKVASKVTPSRPAAKTGKKQGTSPEVRKSEEGFSPAEANRALARNKAESLAKTKAPAPKTTPPAPKAASKAKPSPRKRTRYNEDEAGAEFSKGGMAKRGWGKARCK
jgi:hypothetical protein